MPRPEEKPPTEGGKSVMIEYIIAQNEALIAELEEEIKDLKQINESLNE
jgi:hypothetical protein